MMTPEETTEHYARARKLSHVEYLRCEACLADHGDHAYYDRMRAIADHLEKMESTLKRIGEWDHMDTAADGPYWRQEIAAALGSDNEGR